MDNQNFRHFPKIPNPAGGQQTWRAGSVSVHGI